MFFFPIPSFGANLRKAPAYFRRFGFGGCITFLQIVLRKPYCGSAGSTCAAGGEHWTSISGHRTHSSGVNIETRGKQKAETVTAEAQHNGGSPHYSDVRRQFVWNSPGRVEADGPVSPARKLKQEETQEQDAERAVQRCDGQEQKLVV